MSVDTDRPTFACRCLNIRLFRRKDNQPATQKQPGAYVGYEALYVGDDGINIAHTELTLRTRYAIASDESSTTGHSQRTLVTCLVCDTAAYRVKTEATPDADAKEGPVLPTEEWAERDTLMSRVGFVDVHVGTGGCVDAQEIVRILSSSSYSPYFSLAIPSDSHIAATAPTLPNAKLAIPASHSFFSSLPPFLPPPPFTPSHPIFLRLSSEATASSNAARLDAEKRIEEFANQQLAQVEERETVLRTQLEQLWRIVKERTKKAERERDAELFQSLQSRRRSMSPGRAAPGLGLVGSPTVRSFVPSTYTAPRSSSSVARHSTLSASLATSSFHHPKAVQEANNGHTGSTHRAPSTPSPPPYASDPSSSSSSPGSTSKSAVNISRSLKRNMDATNDIAVTYKWYAFEEQEAARRKTNEKIKRERENSKANRTENGTRESAKTTEPSVGGQPQSTTKSKEAAKPSTTDNKVDSPKRKEGRRKVTFDSEPNVVTIKRDITAEAEQERIPESGEDLLFDMDGVDTTNPVRRDEGAVESIPNDPQNTLKFHEDPERSQKTSRRQNDVKDAGLPQSFVALRPSSLPAPSHVRPPIRSRNNSSELESTSTPPISNNVGSSKAMDVVQPNPVEETPQTVLSPEQKNLLKLVAADSPSHRGLWKQGSDAWKIFDRNGSLPAGTNSTILEEDEEGESSGPSGANDAQADPAWSHYRRPDIAGSVPIPMAPISQQKPGGALSLQPKTSGASVPSLPAVAEEAPVQKQKSAAASRKEVYDERNKVRGLDPGILDFDYEEDEDASSSVFDDELNQVSASRSRQHALKIIQARNSVPAEGLWRSLA